MIELEAGSALDALVAEKIMQLVPCDGWEPINFGSGGGPAVMKRCDHAPNACYSTVVYGGGGCPRYSTEIRYAWEIVERMRELEKCVTVFCYPDPVGPTGGGWWVSIDQPDSSRHENQAINVDTAPLAICLAALTVCS